MFFWAIVESSIDLHHAKLPSLDWKDHWRTYQRIRIYIQSCQTHYYVVFSLILYFNFSISKIKFQPWMDNYINMQRYWSLSHWISSAQHYSLFDRSISRWQNGIRLANSIVQSKQTIATLFLNITKTIWYNSEIKKKTNIIKVIFVRLMLRKPHF